MVIQIHLSLARMLFCAEKIRAFFILLPSVLGNRNKTFIFA